MTSFIWYENDWVDVSRFAKVPRKGPFIISDSLSDMRNPIDGKIYDSKSRYYQTVKSAGCHIMDDAEINHRQKLRVDTASRDEIAKAAHEVFSRQPKKGKKR